MTTNLQSLCIRLFQLRLARALVTCNTLGTAEQVFISIHRKIKFHYFIVCWISLKHSYYFTNAIAVLREINGFVSVIYTPAYTNFYAYAHVCTDTKCTYVLFCTMKKSN